MRHRSLDERAGITSVPADQAVEKNEAEVGPAFAKFLHGLDDFPNTLSFSIDPAVAEDSDLIRRRTFFRQGIEDIRVDSAGRAKTGDTVFPFDPPADAFRVPQ